MSDKDEVEETEAEATLDEPVLDGAKEAPTGDEDPRKGQTDPALIRHPEEGDETIAPYNL